MIKRYVISSILLLTALALASCASTTEVPQGPTTLPTETPAPMAPTEEPTLESTVEPTLAESDGRVTFEHLGISLIVPEDLLVIKDPMVSLDNPTKLQGYLFYIQNYGPEEGPGEDYLQIYGHLQYGLDLINWEEYAADVLSSEMYAYAKEIVVNGLSGIDSQFSGQRNRYVYHFVLDGRVLTMAVADPSEQNKALADQIINTLQFTPGSVTDASGVGLLVEPNDYYQMYIPENWEFSYGEAAGVRLSDLQASSPYQETVITETDGAHDNISFMNGVLLNVVVLEDDSAKNEPVMAQVLRSNPIMISGIEGMDYVFHEPSTVEGEIRELRYYHNDLSYLIRFSYAVDADREQIDWLVRNFQITQ